MCFDRSSVIDSDYSRVSFYVLFNCIYFVSSIDFIRFFIVYIVRFVLLVRVLNNISFVFLSYCNAGVEGTCVR